MKYILCACLLMAALIACNNRGKVPRLGNDSTHDGPIVEPVWAEEVAKFQKLVKTNHIINNPMVVSGDTLLVNLQHYARKDAPFIIKGKFYNWGDADTIRAYPFETKISVLRADSTLLLDTLITGKMITSNLQLDDYLQQYGLLLFLHPLRSEGDFLIVPYSFSIPITDLGRGVHIYIKKDGSEFKVTD
jgi:hypothetical protein